MKRDTEFENKCIQSAKEAEIEKKLVDEKAPKLRYEQLKKVLNVEILEFPKIIISGIVGKIDSIGFGLTSLVLYRYDDDDNIVEEYVSEYQSHIGDYLQRVPAEKRAYHINYFGHKENSIFKHAE